MTSQTGLTRLFDVAGGGIASDVQTNLRWLRIFLFVHLAARSVFRLSSDAMVRGDRFAELICQLLIVCCIAGLLPWLARRATQVVAGLMAIHILQTLPVTANHTFLEFLAFAVLAFLDESEEGEEELAVKVLRWMVVLVLFYSGLQKLIYGRYFDGQFLAYAAATTDRFSLFMQLLIPADEFLRLRAMSEADVGMGPYRVDSLLFIAISNSVYVIEMLLAVLLLIGRTRIFAAIGSVLFITLIELGARELMFGALMLNFLMLFLPGRMIKYLFFPLAVMYAYLVATNYDLVPMFLFHY